MAVKVISVYLMFSCDMKLTEEEYNAFAGSDPSTYCKTKQTMEAECNKLGIAVGATDGQTCFLEGYPHCSSGKVSLKDSKGDKVLKDITNVLFCYWTNNNQYAMGKGKNPHHMMRYDQDSDQTYYPCEDLPV
ncbi:uncharacterized protein LOC135847081 [Planococcus citri]|uniref:uncharacterized protein LOC135847081 n=1 Tax=Planococcus citri TaxID=170843 RepID=UPI0031F8151E